MHTKIIRTPEGEARVHHNSDWSGDAFVGWMAGVGNHERVALPGWLARRLVTPPRRSVRPSAASISAMRKRVESGAERARAVPRG